MRRALPRVPLGGSDQIRRLQAGTIPTDSPGPFSAGEEPQLVLSAVVPSAAAGGLVVPEPGNVAVAGRAVGLPVTRSQGAGCSVEGGLVAADVSSVVSVSGSHGVVVRAVVGSCVWTLGSGGSAVVVTGPAVLRLPVVATTVWGLPMEVAMATGCSVTAANTASHGRPRRGSEPGRGLSGTHYPHGVTALRARAAQRSHPPPPHERSQPWAGRGGRAGAHGHRRHGSGDRDRDGDGRFAEWCRNGGCSRSSKAVSSSTRAMGVGSSRQTRVPSSQLSTYPQGSRS